MSRSVHPSMNEFLKDSKLQESKVNSTEIEFGGKTYYVDSNALEDKKVSKVFAFTDKKLLKIAKTNKGTLMFDKSQIEYILKK